MCSKLIMLKMDKYSKILFVISFSYAIDCSFPYVANHTDDYCIPADFYYQSSTLQAAYFFINVTIEGSAVSSQDWVGAFNEEICVGARKWDTNECGNGVCEVPVLGYSDSSTAGYMLPGQVPTFKIFRASDETYHDAYPSENFPWYNFETPVIESLSIDCIGLVDECGVCNGSGAIYECGCQDIPGGDCDCNGNQYDECGMCGGTGIPDGECDCFGNVDFGCGCGEAGPSGCDDACGSNLEFDACGVCGGGGIPQGNCDCNGNIEDCAGICGGDSVVDNCGICDNNPNNDCDADCNGLFEGDEGYTGDINDECGVCGGPGAIYECGCIDILEGECDCEGNVEDDYGVCGGINECQGYDIGENTFTMLNNGQVLYHSLSSISGIQFTIEFNQYCGDLDVCPNIPIDSGVNSIQGGVLGNLVDDNNWSLFYDNELNQNGQVQILAFANDLNSLINPGCGVLMNLDYSGSVNDYIDIIWSDENAQDIGVIYFETDILNNNIPNQFILKQNYPNPFNPVTFIEFEIDYSDYVELVIYDIKGNQVKKLIDEFLNKDSYRVSWDGKDDNFMNSPSGVYIASLVIDGMISSKKLTLIK